jgi:hypothetical protein
MPVILIKHTKKSFIINKLYDILGYFIRNSPLKRPYYGENAPQYEENNRSKTVLSYKF